MKQGTIKSVASVAAVDWPEYMNQLLPSELRHMRYGTSELRKREGTDACCTTGNLCSAFNINIDRIVVDSRTRTHGVHSELSRVKPLQEFARFIVEELCLTPRSYELCPTDTLENAFEHGGVTNDRLCAAWERASIRAGYDAAPIPR